MLTPALAAGVALGATVVNMRWIKPLDTELLIDLARSHEAFVTVEEHAVMGGAGSACGEFFAAEGIGRPLLQLGLPDRFIDHGDHKKLLADLGLDEAGIEASIRQRFYALLRVESGPRLVAQK
jgi:1-deoxy-D-xylulose-5-phosphate synthase